MSDIRDQLDTADHNLRSSGYDVSRNVSLSNNLVADVVASHFEATLGSIIGIQRVFIFQHFILRHVSTAMPDSFTALFQAGLTYAKNQFRGSILRRKQYCHVIVPCLAVDTGTPELVAYASGSPPKHWFKFELPVLHDLSTGQTHYYDGNAAWGGMFLLGAQVLAGTAFAPQSDG